MPLVSDSALYLTREKRLDVNPEEEEAEVGVEEAMGRDWRWLSASSVTDLFG